MEKIATEGLVPTISEVTGIKSGDPMLQEIVNAYKEVEKI